MPFVSFFQRPYPSANSILLHGHRAVLVDSGFGADAPHLLAWLGVQGVVPGQVRMVVNTHFHSDHVGGNYALQRRFGVVIGASALDSALVNSRDPDACRAEWLRQPVEPFSVGRTLDAGDVVATGDSRWTVIATPGHTAGHISLHSAELGILVLGDALHDTDLGWISPFRETADPIARSRETLDRLERLPARIGYSGHGPAINNLPAAFARARRRLQSWQEDPQRMGWHACKRIFSHALMLKGGLAEAALASVLLDAPWFRDHAEHVFGLAPERFVPMLVEEMERSGAAQWRGGRLIASAEHLPVPAGWPHGPASPDIWPAPTPPASRLAVRPGGSLGYASR